MEPLRSHRSRQKAEDDSSHYDEIVVFSKDDDIICADMSSTDICRTDIENAKAGLLALNLSEQGLAALEAACLNELDAMANLEGVTLHEYTVLVPKNRALSYTYYGAYHGVPFYTSLSIKKEITYEKNDIGTGQKILQWSSAAVNLFMCFAGKEISLPWAVVSSNLPSNFTVRLTDWTDYYANAEAITRSIYAKSVSAYLHVYSREYGNFRPYLVYHTNSMHSGPTATTAYRTLILMPQQARQL